MKPSRITLLFASLLTLFPISLTQAQSNTSPPSRTQPQTQRENRNNQQNRRQRRENIRFIPPTLPSRGRPTGRRRGGASRGSCNLAAGQPPLTALIPTSEEINPTAERPNNTSIGTVFSLTASPSPSFWFYLPYPPNETPLKFVLQDENNNTLYQETLSTTADEPGIVQITLPSTAPALEENTSYHWFLIANCDDTNPAFVDGWTTRIPLNDSLASASETATLREQAILYAQEGIWQESLTLLGEHYRENTEDSSATSDWQSLLESADLADLANQPLIDCCEAPSGNHD